MTNAAVQRELKAMKADIRRLQEAAKVSATAEKARVRLRAEILKGLASGKGKLINETYWQRLHTLAERHAKKT